MVRTDGLASFSQIKENSVDLIFSQAVLEHIRKHEFLETMRACRRVISPTGIMSHKIDFKDHLGGALNNLRFNEKIWESDCFVKSGFYTNRIRYSEMLEIFEEAGFKVEVLKIDFWEKLPTPRNRLHSKFSILSDSDLLVKGSHILLHPI